MKQSPEKMRVNFAGLMYDVRPVNVIGDARYRIADLIGPRSEANAALIVAAWNSCVEINPENPIRAAEKMVEAIEALKKIANWEFDIMGDCVAEARQVARRAFLDATDREAA